MEADKSAAEAQVQQCLDEIVASNDVNKAIAGLDILHKLISNILKNPGEDQFRIFKKSNKAIQGKVLALQPSGVIIRLIEALGYINLDDDFHTFTGDYFVVLGAGSRMIETESMKLKMTLMSEEDRKKQELIMANQAAYRAKQQADAEFKKKLVEQQERDRLEKKHQKIEASHANELKFGANLVKFEPPAAQRGG